MLNYVLKCHIPCIVHTIFYANKSLSSLEFSLCLVRNSLGIHFVPVKVARYRITDRTRIRPFFYTKELFRSPIVITF